MQHLFSDVNEMASGRARCEIHNKSIDISKLNVDILSCGWCYSLYLHNFTSWCFILSHVSLVWLREMSSTQLLTNHAPPWLSVRSCKDLSSCNTKRQSHSADCLKKGQGTSGGTFQGCLGVIDLLNPGLTYICAQEHTSFQSHSLDTSCLCVWKLCQAWSWWRTWSV